MTRDWEIIRAILLRLEQSPTADTAVNAGDFPNMPEQNVAYNMRLLHEEGFIDARYIESHSGDGEIMQAFARRLTNSGHELLDTIRDDTVWNQIKEKFKSNSIDMTFDLIMTVGKKIIESILLP